MFDEQDIADRLRESSSPPPDPMKLRVVKYRVRIPDEVNSADSLTVWRASKSDFRDALAFWLACAADLGEGAASAICQSLPKEEWHDLLLDCTEALVRPFADPPAGEFREAMVMFADADWIEAICTTDSEYYAIRRVRYV